MAYRLARDAGTWPTRTTSAHIEELRHHYSDREIQETIETIIAGSWLTSDMQSQLTVTDRLAMSWALHNLSEVGWRPGAHLGRPNEMRAYHMTEMADYAAAKMNSGQIIDQVSEWVGVKVPLGVDSDSDGVEDGFDGFPNDPSRWSDTDRNGVEDSFYQDTDVDCISNADDVAAGGFPYKADSDGDGVDELAERKAGSDPVDPGEF